VWHEVDLPGAVMVGEMYAQYTPAITALGVGSSPQRDRWREWAPMPPLAQTIINIYYEDNLIILHLFLINGVYSEDVTQVPPYSGHG
jgi:hypothetical protein